ncbi:MmcQ/YjbR family DNA-binding protein [Thalassotalea sp. HSM 43]|uniref:MmcQ/YjbR family DNA-binding protein n=1 Tax=Thalassotalea sp. HSM 43 TaxID=2552945 RepID=UPI001E44E6C9|nr:MmcQ/YjbR family DNA-binding protein [Thalassotalea sp. HSM 43]
MQQLSQYLLAKPKTTLSFPFNQDVHVYKVNNKMFALLTWRNDCLMINLKCDSDESLALQDIFKSITSGYHMDNYHCNIPPVSKSLQTNHSSKVVFRHDTGFQLQTLFS